MFDPPFVVKPPSDRDVVVVHPEHWIFAGTGVSYGSAIPGLLGNEMDRIFPSSPTNLPLAHSPVIEDGELRGHADMTLYYHSGSRAMVFAAGTLQWPWGLDSYIGSIAHAPRENEVAKQITRNLLAEFIREPVLDVDQPSTPVLFEAWPVPFRPRFGNLTLRVASGGAEEMPVVIYDVQGRLIANRVARRTGTELVATWNGRDDMGRVVTAGIYVLHCAAGHLRIAVLD
jgi:hypothetical protein